LEAFYIAAGFRTLVAPADEEGYWNERLAALETEMDRAEHITTELQLREAQVTARLRGLLSYLPDHSSTAEPGDQIERFLFARSSRKKKQRISNQTGPNPR
jgi:hypothetical protein